MSRSLYEILGVAQSASDAEIRAAFEQLTRQHETRAPGTTSADTNVQNKKLDEAYRTFSDRARRCAYDASLQKDIAPPRLEIAIRKARWSPHKILLIVIGVLISMGLTLDIGFSLLNDRTTGRAVAEAQESIVRLREYELEMGRRSLDDITADQQVDEKHRLEYEAQGREDALEASRRYAASISDARIRAEEQAKSQAHQQAEHQRAEEQRRKDEAEVTIQRQLAAEKERLRELESSNSR